MKRGINTGILAVMMISVFCLSGCSKNLYENSKNGYTSVSSISGVVFDMPENFLSKASTISEISPDGDYAEGAYLYKDAETYLLFNIEEAVIAVERNTTFHIADAEENEIETAIKNTSVEGVWMSARKEEISFDTGEKDGTFKIIADVIGNVSITPECYGKYTGYFASVQKDGYECSMFVGVKLSNSDTKMTLTQKNILKHIIKSFRISEDVEMQSETE